MMAKQRKRRGALFWLLCLAVAGGALFAWLYTHNGRRGEPRAVVTQMSGDDATVVRDGNTMRLAPTSAIYSGDVLATQDHPADIGLQGGATLRLGPLTHLQVGPGTNAFHLTAGAIRIETTSQSPSFTIGAPYAVATTPAYAVSILDVSIDSGMYVRLGNVMVDMQGKPITLIAGQHLTVDGLQLKIGPNDPMTLEDMVFHGKHPTTAQNANVRAPHRPSRVLPLILMGDAGTQLAHQGLIAQHIDNHRQPLQPGDTVITDTGSGRILVGKWGELVLDGKSAVTVVATHQGEADAEAGLQVTRGGMQIHLTTDKHEARTLKVQSGAQELSIMPGYEQAVGHFGHVPKEPTLTLRLGRGQAGAQAFEAGSIVHIEGSGPDAAVRVTPLSDAPVEVAGSSETVVHHIGMQPAIKFRWDPAADASKQLLEVARDAEFRDVRWVEYLRHGSAVVDTLKSGRKYWWRVDKRKANSMRLVPQSPPGCASCPGPNPVTDELARTVIQFEEAMPDLDFTWQHIEGASTYLFRLWRDNHFDIPAYVTHAQSPNIIVPADRLLPGGFVWRVAGYDGEGHLVRTTQSFELNVQDLDLRVLSVVSPPPNALVYGATTMTLGEVAGGASLTCNGHPVVVGDDGTFKHEVPLHAGENFLIYAVRETKGVRHVFTRVVRRAPESGHAIAAPKLSEDQ